MLDSRIYRKLRKTFNFDIVERKWASKVVAQNGHFLIHIIPDSNNPNFFKVIPEFKVIFDQTLDSNLMVLKKFHYYLNCGVLFKRNNFYNYLVNDLTDLETVIIPFFAKKYLKHKRRDFTFFCNVFKLILKGEHLTSLGISKIIEMKLDFLCKKRWDKFHINNISVDEVVNLVIKNKHLTYLDKDIVQA
jgi:LAGLIDADG endonuclease